MEVEGSIKRDLWMFIIFAIFGFGGLGLYVFMDAGYIVCICSIFLVISLSAHFKHWKDGKIKALKEKEVKTCIVRNK